VQAQGFIPVIAKLRRVNPYTGRFAMAGNEIEKAFARIRSFEWDEKKRIENWRRHKVEFDAARTVISDYALIRRSDRSGEIRYQVFGYIDDREVTVVCTIREDRCRIISARRAREDERRKYYDRLPRRAAEGQD
jgi:uncharacterized protein